MAPLKAAVQPRMFSKQLQMVKEAGPGKQSLEQERSVDQAQPKASFFPRGSFGAQHTLDSLGLWFSTSLANLYVQNTYITIHSSNKLTVMK